jgi:hypothetical protein
MRQDANSIADRICSQRKCGCTTCVIQARDAATPASGNVLDSVDDFVTAQGFQGIGAGWVEISRLQSHTILTSILHKDLAYGSPLMKENQASELAEEFLSTFAGNAQFFTNGNEILPDADPNSVPGSGNSLSTSTFDTGVVCLDESCVGMLWVEDED